MWFKKKKSPEERQGPSAWLSLSTVDEEPVIVFPDQVVAGIRYMLTRLNREGKIPGRIALVASLRQEGVTYLSRALATVMANDMAESVCVVELNWWWPSSLPLVTDSKPGLAEVISGKANLDDVIAATSLKNLFVVPSGIIERNECPVVARSQQLKNIIDVLSQRFDHLILDIPAVLTTSDAVPLASLATACCVVIQQGVTATSDVKNALDEIKHLSVLGVMMNRVQRSTPIPILKLAGEQL